MKKSSVSATRGLTRRDVLKHLAAGAGMAVAGSGILRGQGGSIRIAGQTVEITIWSLSAETVRITVLPRVNGAPQSIAPTGALEREQLGTLIRREITFFPEVLGRAGNMDTASIQM